MRVGATKSKPARSIRNQGAKTNGNHAKLARPKNPQAFTNGEIHNWFNFILGFSDKLVSGLMERLDIKKGQRVFDPFCGTGTTLVESMKRGISSIGLDASPFSCFVSRVKTNSRLEPARLLASLIDVRLQYEDNRHTKVDHSRDRTFRYLKDSGMLKRGWISGAPLLDALALKNAIIQAVPAAAYRNVLLLALASNLSTKIGNMKFGPEIYRGRRKRSVCVWRIFERSVAQMIKDLFILEKHKLDNPKLGSAKVFRGDARNCSGVLRRYGIKKVHAAISSPPYPTEHDYTRNTRLELAFLDFVATKDCVKAIKKRMIRSHTKGIYKTDRDQDYVRDDHEINRLATRVARRCKGKTYGFARLYPAVIRQYFGGMKRHFKSMSSIIVPGGRYGIVVGDQASYLGIHVPTAALLGRLAQECGFVVEESSIWRKRRASKTSKLMKEHVLILRKAAH